MGRGIIQHPETKKYAIWSSIVDDFISDWLSEDELKQWEINDYIERIKGEEIKITPFKTFDECLNTIEAYHGKDRVDEVKDCVSLKPCFCGGHRTIKLNTHSAGMGECYENWEMHCSKCDGLWTLSADNFYGATPHSRAEAINIWNAMVNWRR